MVDEKPDGEQLHIFHICTKGLESRILFRNEDDFNRAVNLSAICAYSIGVRIVVYCMMSNHVHYIVLCSGKPAAAAFANKFKKCYSQYMKVDSGICGIFRHVKVTVKEIGSMKYLRDCIAYVLRNPIESGSVKYADHYEWSSASCYFSAVESSIYVNIKSVPLRVACRALGTHEDLRGSKFLLDENFNIVPKSFVDARFVETVFDSSKERLWSSIMRVNYHALEYELSYSKAARYSDYELMEIVQKDASQHFNKDVRGLSVKERCRMITKLRCRYNASTAQICRLLALDRKLVCELVDSENDA